jgi:hypothetical protein
MMERQEVPSTTVQMAFGIEPGERHPVCYVISTLDGTTGQAAVVSTNVWFQGPLGVIKLLVGLGIT